MNRSAKRVLLFASIAAGLVLCTSAETQAHWRRWCRAHCRWGCCGASMTYIGYGTGSYGCWGSGFANYGSYGSSGYGSSGYGSSGYGSAGYGSAGYGSAGNNVPAAAGPVDGDTPPIPVDGRAAFYPGYVPAQDTALLTAHLPADAQVVVNGAATASRGAVRHFRSRELTPGETYLYHMTATLAVDADSTHDLVAEKTVRLRAGEKSDVRFEMSDFAVRNLAALEKESQTSLTLHVPENAKVYLAGNLMKATGPVRQYTTNRLPAGAKWSDYTVRVEAEVDGQMQTREQTLSLKAGESRELTIDFSAAQVASKTSR